jgi:hypothetical protein
MVTEVSKIMIHIVMNKNNIDVMSFPHEYSLDLIGLVAISFTKKIGEVS